MLGSPCARASAPCSLLILFVLRVARGWHEPLMQGAKLSFNERDDLSKNALLSAQKAFVAEGTSVFSQANVTAACYKCARDFQLPCPEGWTEEGDGQCSAPAAYSGFCARRQVFTGADKREAEYLCGICWPCKSEALGCARNWEAHCPLGYKLLDIPYHGYA